MQYTEGMVEVNIEEGLVQAQEYVEHVDFRAAMFINQDRGGRSTRGRGYSTGTMCKWRGDREGVKDKGERGGVRIEEGVGLVSEGFSRIFQPVLPVSPSKFPIFVISPSQKAGRTGRTTDHTIIMKQFTKFFVNLSAAYPYQLSPRSFLRQISPDYPYYPGIYLKTTPPISHIPQGCKLSPGEAASCCEYGHH